MHQAMTDQRFVAAPKALLHDHLDGGLRPADVVEIADEVGHELPDRRRPTARPLVRRRRELAARWSATWRPSSTPSRVMQRAEAWPGRRRVRRGPGRRRRRLRRGAVRPRAAPDSGLDASTRSSRRSGTGSTRASAAQAAAGSPIVVRQLVTAMRHARTLAGDRRSSPCGTATTASCGFDIAGAEAGFPPTRHLDAFEYLQRENAHFTIHAGEAFGLPSIWEALQWCGADRLGHGVRIVDDIDARRATDRCSSAGSRRTSATGASRWRCARRRTCRPARRRRSPSTRSGCSPSCGSGSRSTPTTG